MDYKVHKKYLPIFNLPPNIRYVILMGGRGAGRSFIVSLWLKLKLLAKQFMRGAIMRFILGDIRDSNFREITDRIEESGTANNFEIKDSLYIGSGGNFVKGIGFRKSSSDQRSKLKSLAKFNVVDIEEADEIPQDDFMQLDDSLRTKDGQVVIFLKLNSPPKNHWIIKRFFNLVPSDVEGFYKPVLKDSCKHNTLFIFTTYKDNIKNLNQTTIDNYESYQKTHPDYYWNMIRGLVSEGAKGLIYKNWQVIPDDLFDELPFQSFYGLDFGFTNHPTALVELKRHNNNVWAKELLYETGLNNKRISERMAQLGVSRTAPIYADCAEPKSIDEIFEDDWNIIPATKGADSVRAGVGYMLALEVAHTEGSVNIAKERQAYCWALDRNKEPTNEPVDKDNHSMDAIRYGVCTHAGDDYVGAV